MFPNLNCVPNPHTCSLGGRVITTVSGANITDILSNTNLKVGPGDSDGSY